MSRRRPSRQPQAPPPEPPDAETGPPATGSSEAAEPASDRVSNTRSAPGPLPPPALLAKYNEAFPGCAERIVAMTERQLTHRHALESRVVEGKLAAERTGQRLGFVLVLAALAVGAGLIAFDEDTAGLTAIVGALASVVAIFVYGRRKEAEERRQKRAELTSPQLRLPDDDPTPEPHGPKSSSRQSLERRQRGGYERHPVGEDELRGREDQLARPDGSGKAADRA